MSVCPGFQRECGQPVYVGVLCDGCRARSRSQMLNPTAADELFAAGGVEVFERKGGVVRRRGN